MQRKQHSILIVINHSQLVMLSNSAIFSGKFPPGKFFSRKKLVSIPFFNVDTTTQNVPPPQIVTELISKQQWSQLKIHLETTTNPTTVVQQLFNSGADTDLVLSYFDWSTREFKITYTLELTCRLLHSLSAAKMYSNIKNLLNGLVKDESFCSVSSIFRAFSLCSGDRLCDDHSRVIGMLVVAYVRNKKPHLGFEALKRADDYGLKLSVVSCNQLLNYLVKQSEIEDAILKDMVESGIPADEFTFNILIDGFCKDRNVLAAMKVFDEMQTQGVTASLITYCSLIHGLCACGKLDEAIALRDQMMCSGLKPDIFTYSAIIKVFCKKKMVDKARELFDDLVKQGMVPTSLMYNTLVDAYCKSRRTEDAFALHNFMLDRGVLPNTATYNSLIGGLYSKGDTEGAKRLKNELANKGLKIDNIGLG
ncbi:hypothetical protein QYF36_013958 [Acer negundo]|nr:hypothetical protein QYF36_013958 [Acer negundo]